MSVEDALLFIGKVDGNPDLAQELREVVGQRTPEEDKSLFERAGWMPDLVSVMRGQPEAPPKRLQQAADIAARNEWVRIFRIARDAGYEFTSEEYIAATKVYKRNFGRLPFALAFGRFLAPGPPKGLSTRGQLKTVSLRKWWQFWK